MSAQRRTTTKEKAPSPANAPTPAVRSKDKPAADRSSKAVSEAKQSIVAQRTQPMRQMFRDSWSEMKKVNWPDQQTTRNLTVVVIGISTVLGILLGGIDFLLEKLFQVLS